MFIVQRREWIEGTWRTFGYQTVCGIIETECRSLLQGQPSHSWLLPSAHQAVRKFLKSHGVAVLEDWPKKSGDIMPLETAWLHIIDKLNECKILAFDKVTIVSIAAKSLSWSYFLAQSFARYYWQKWSLDSIVVLKSLRFLVKSDDNNCFFKLGPYFIVYLIVCMATFGTYHSSTAIFHWTNVFL